MEIPPAGEGGETEFADSRTAWDDLDEETRALLLANGGLVGGHSISHSRKMGSPEFFKELDVDKAPMSLHRMAQVHEPSGRMNLYIGGHLHHVEGMDRAKSDALIRKLNRHATQEKYVISVGWEAPGDLVVWDNRAVMVGSCREIGRLPLRLGTTRAATDKNVAQHRATGGPFEDKYKRDMRRTTVHDDGTYAWGLNRVGETMPGFDSYTTPGGKAAVES